MDTPPGGAPARRLPGARADWTRAAEERGAAMSLVTAAECALLLSAPGPEQAPAPPGPHQLSKRERELVILVAQGHTDRRGPAVHQRRTVARSWTGSATNRLRPPRRLTRLALTAGWRRHALPLAGQRQQTVQACGSFAPPAATTARVSRDVPSVSLGTWSEVTAAPGADPRSIHTGPTAVTMAV